MKASTKKMLYWVGAIVLIIIAYRWYQKNKNGAGIIPSLGGAGTGTGGGLPIGGGGASTGGQPATQGTATDEMIASVVAPLQGMANELIGNTAGGRYANVTRVGGSDPMYKDPMVVDNTASGRKLCYWEDYNGLHPIECGTAPIGSIINQGQA